MTNREIDPTRDIRDIDTFSLYLVGYRNQVCASRSSFWASFFPQYTPPENPQPWVFLSIHWQETPPSIQEVMKLQYPAASVDERKTVTLRLHIPNGRISVTLHSNSIIEGFRAGSDCFDKVGRIVIPDEGLILPLRGSPASKGKWIFIHRPANTSEVEFVQKQLAEQLLTGDLSNLEKQETRLYETMERMMKNPVQTHELITRAVTLQELHDIIRTLEAGKTRAAWGETLGYPVAYPS